MKTRERIIQLGGFYALVRKVENDGWVSYQYEIPVLGGKWRGESVCLKEATQKLRSMIKSMQRQKLWNTVNEIEAERALKKTNT